MSNGWDTDAWEDGIGDTCCAEQPARFPWAETAAKIWPDGTPTGIDEELARWGLSVPSADGSRTAKPEDWAPIVKAVAEGVRWVDFAEVFRRKRDVRFMSMAAWMLAIDLSKYRLGDGIEFLIIDGCGVRPERIGVRVPRRVSKNFAVPMRSMRAWRVAAGADGSRERIVKGGDFYTDEGRLNLPDDAQFFWSVPSTRWDELLHHLRFVHPYQEPEPLLAATVADDVVVGSPADGVFTVKLPRQIPQVGSVIKACGGLWDPREKRWVVKADRYDEFVVAYTALFEPR